MTTTTATMTHHRTIMFAVTDKELDNGDDTGWPGWGVDELDELAEDGWEVVGITYHRMRIRTIGTNEEWGFTGTALMRKPATD
jgi:hypothetical protein